MVATLHPVVDGTYRGRNWYSVIGIYTLFQIAGAALTGLLFSAAGAFGRNIFPWEDILLVGVLGGCGVVGALLDFGLLNIRLPSRCWQVPPSWQRFSPRRTAAYFGFFIGVGVVTQIPVASFYLLLLGCAGFGGFTFGASVMAFYGLSRAGMVALLAHGQASALDPPRRLMTIGRLTPLIGYLDGLALALVSGMLLTRTVLLYFT